MTADGCHNQLVTAKPHKIKTVVLPRRMMFYKELKRLLH